ncbi:hypothetical protein LTR10_001621 [Elasticomyces elasticus]|nr:hypothetical protein LTR10_001621 [Elasticomyces elasticus]KAK4975124.1 hypothetical protein LTR42_004334 [Elasticomyces elasticus]
MTGYEERPARKPKSGKDKYPVPSYDDFSEKTNPDAAVEQPAFRTVTELTCTICIPVVSKYEELSQLGFQDGTISLGCDLLESATLCTGY